MNLRHLRVCVASLLAVLVLWPMSAFGLDSSRINEIRRAANPEKLEELAEKYLKDDATRKPKDFEEGTQIATEMATYLLFIQVRQNQLLLQKLDELIAK